MPTTLITGVSRGIGREFALQYVREGWKVCGIVRDPKSIAPLEKMGVECHVVDVANPAAIEQLSRQLSNAPIDALIANAGVYEGFDARLADIGVEAVVNGFAVNAIAPIILAKAFRNHVKSSEQRKMIAITSKLAFSNSNIGHLVYRSSKAALNAGWRALALEEPGIIAMLLRPGRVATRMSPGATLSVQESVAGMRNVIANATQKDSGCCYDYRGEDPLP